MTLSTLLIALTGACALVAAAVIEVPPDTAGQPSLAQSQQERRDCGRWAAELADPAPPGDPHVHARALGGCLSGPGYSVK